MKIDRRISEIWRPAVAHEQLDASLIPAGCHRVYRFALAQGLQRVKTISVDVSLVCQNQ
jgi:hypothetical protein